MTPRAAQLTARLRIARKVGRWMPCRLGLCSESHRSEDSQPASLARTPVATPGTESVESWEHRKEHADASSTPGPRGLTADGWVAFDDRLDHVAGPGQGQPLGARPRSESTARAVPGAPPAEAASGRPGTAGTRE